MSSTGFLVSLYYTNQKTSSDNVGDNVGDKRLLKILVLMTENKKISASELSVLLNVAGRTIERDIGK